MPQAPRPQPPVTSSSSTGRERHHERTRRAPNCSQATGRPAPRPTRSDRWRSPRTSTGASTPLAPSINFPISRRAISNYPDLVRALARVKQARHARTARSACSTPAKADIIDAVCERIVAGELHDQFVVGVDPGRCGHQHEHEHERGHRERGPRRPWAREFGDYSELHPIDDVNRSQSTNDVYPTAIKLAMVFGVQRLLEEHALLTKSFAAKGREFAHVLKVGRTQLQDAVPMTLGQEFTGFAHTLQEDFDRLSEVIPWLNEINMGATAIGTGHHRRPALRGGGAQAPRRGHRHPAGDRPRPDRGHRRRRHLHDPERHAEARRGQAVEDLQRPAAASRRARRPGSARSSCRPRQAGSSDHARQGEPGDPRGGQPGRVQRDRRGCDGHRRRGGRPAAAERLRAGDRAQPAAVARLDDERLPHAAGQLHRRHHRRTPSGSRSRSSRASASSRRSRRTSATRHRRPSRTRP